MSYFFLPVPKCLWDTSAPVPNCLNILWRGRSVQRTLRHWYRSVSDRSAARSCSCIASPLHVTSAPSIAIFRQRLKTYCIYEIIPDIHIWLITHFNNISLFPMPFLPAASIPLAFQDVVDNDHNSQLARHLQYVIEWRGWNLQYGRRPRTTWSVFRQPV